MKECLLHLGKQMCTSNFTFIQTDFVNTSNALYNVKKHKKKVGRNVVIFAIKKQISRGRISPANQIVESEAIETYADFKKRRKRQKVVWKWLCVVRLIHHYNSTTMGSSLISQPSVAPEDLLKQVENNWSFKNWILFILEDTLSGI